TRVIQTPCRAHPDQLNLCVATPGLLCRRFRETSATPDKTPSPRRSCRGLRDKVAQVWKILREAYNAEAATRQEGIGAKSRDWRGLSHGNERQTAARMVLAPGNLRQASPRVSRPGLLRITGEARVGSVGDGNVGESRCQYS